MNVTDLKARFKGDPLYMGNFGLPQMFMQDSPDFHKELVADYLDHRIDKGVYIAPRGFAKSSILAGLCALHHLEFAPFQQKFILFISKTQEHAAALVDTVKNIVSGEDGAGIYAQVFGVRGKHNSPSWGSKKAVLPCGSVLMARGTGQQVVGLKKDSQRPTLIIFDDPEDMNNTRTPEAMEFNFRWMMQSVVPARAMGGRVFVIGTPQHELCMVETLMKTGGWHGRRYSAITGEKWEEDISQAKSLWPERFPVKWLYKEYEDLKGIGRASYFYREYQCVVTGDGDRRFTTTQFRYYKITDMARDKWGRHIMRGRYFSSDGKPGSDFTEPISIQAGVDLASTLGVKRDWTVLFFWGITADKRFFQIPYKRFQATPLDSAVRLKDGLQARDPNFCWVETENFQVMMRDYLVTELGVYYPGMGEGVTSRQNKEERIYDKLQPFYASGRVYHHMGECEQIENELLAFPRGANDDVIDAAHLALRRIYPPEIITHAQEQEREFNEQLPLTDSYMMA